MYQFVKIMLLWNIESAKFSLALLLFFAHFNYTFGHQTLHNEYDDKKD